MASTCDRLGIEPHKRFTDWERLVVEQKPEVGIVCSTTAEHLAWCDRLSRAGVHVILEKPFAMSALEAEAAVSAAQNAGVVLAVNWPLAWCPSHRTTRRLIAEGAIGEVREIHYYGGNRGPQHHLLNPEGWRETWWFDEPSGGGSLMDYLGYGAILATWCRDGELPEAVTAMQYVPSGSAVDFQTVAVARYASGLSTLQSRWGTFTDPWIHQPEPACGLTVVGSAGTILSLDYADTLRLSTEHAPDGQLVPVDEAAPGERDILEALDAALTAGLEVAGPCGSAISLAGQKIVDAVKASVRCGHTVTLKEDAHV